MDPRTASVLDAATVVELLSVLAEIARIVFEAVSAEVSFAGVSEAHVLESNALTTAGGSARLLLVLLVGLAGGVT